MKIYHYTTIDVLALMLEHRTLRFNNVSNVDDLDEAESSDSGSFKSYVFVSCWTADPRENLALWNMYSRNMQGVRICVDDAKIKYGGIRRTDEEGNLRHIHVVDNVRPENPSAVVINWGTWTGQTLDFSDRIPIEYDNDKPRFFSTKYGKNVSVLHLENILSRKNNWWKFQDEVRFALLACSNSSTNSNRMNFPVNDVISNIAEKVPFTCNYVDLELGTDFFLNIEVMSGPKTIEGEKVIIRALLERYLMEKSFTFEESSVRIKKES